MNSRTFLSADGDTKVTLNAEVLQHIYKFAQTRLCQKEAGGQLFSASPHFNEVVISRVTGPHPSDKRHRHLFVPDPVAATHDRFTLFQHDLHSVALWHTHPELSPSPSGADREVTFQYLESFQGEMSSFLLLILGNGGSPLNLAVWMASNHPQRKWSRLVEIVVS